MNELFFFEKIDWDLGWWWFIVDGAELESVCIIESSEGSDYEILVVKDVLFTV